MATTEKAPNIVVFFTDQQRWDTMGLHGNPMGLTPKLDRLARQHTHLELVLSLVARGCDLLERRRRGGVAL